MTGRPKTRIALLLLAAALLAAVLAAPASARPFETGMVLTDPDSYTSSLAMQRIKDSGNKYVKISIPWPAMLHGDSESPNKPAGFDATNPADPNYDFSGIDATVRNAKAAGLEPLFAIGNAPRWARAAGCTDQPICSPNPNDYADFATAISQRYNGNFNPGDGKGVLPRVRYYQAWGEPNLFLFYLPQFKNGKKVSPDNYRTILNAFYSAIKATNPNNVVISAGLAPLQRPGGLGPLDFMRRLLCVGGPIAHPHPTCGQGARLDVWATHPYTTGGPTHKAAGKFDTSLGNLPAMSRTLKVADRSGHIVNDEGRTPFWITEFSWDSNPPDFGGLKMPLFARWMDQAFYEMWKSGVSACMWFGIRDQSSKHAGIGNTAQSGLWEMGSSVAQDKPKKLAIKAYSFPFVALKSGQRILVWGRVPESTNATVRIEQSTGGAYRKLASLKTDSNGIFTRKLSSHSLTGKLRAVETAGPYGGGATSVPFSMHDVPDHYVAPFGGHGQTPNTPVGRVFGRAFGAQFIP